MILNTAPSLSARSTPVAVLGPDDPTVQVGEVILFTGEESYCNDGNISSYAWDLGDGTVGREMTLSHAYSEPGQYTVTLVVTADDGAYSTDTGTVTVLDDHPPEEGWTAWIESVSTPKTTYGPGETINLTAMVERGLDSLTAVWEGTLVLAVLDQTGITVHYEDVDVELAFGGAQRTSYFEFALDEAGNYLLRVSLYRFNDTMVDRKELNVTVTGDENMAPVAIIGPASQLVELGDVATFAGGRSYDPDGIVTSHRWDFGDGTTAGGPNVTHVYRAPGMYNVSLTVWDDQGAMGTAQVSVEVVASTPLPNGMSVWISSLLTGKETYEVGDVMDLTVDVTRKEDLLTWVWEGTLVLELLDTQMVKMGTWERAVYLSQGGTKATFSLAIDLDDAGPHLLVATLYWMDGSLVDARQLNVTVLQQHQNLPPIAGIDPERQTVSTGDTVRLDGSISRDTDGRIVSHLWDLGDGTQAEGPTATHTYRVTGVYNVTLKVTDDDGATSVAYAVVEVLAAVPPSEAWIVSVVARGVVNGSETFTVTVTVVRGQDMLDYVWIGTLVLEVIGGSPVLDRIMPVELATGGETRGLSFELELAEPGTYVVRASLNGQDGSLVDVEDVGITVVEVVPDPDDEPPVVPFPRDRNLPEVSAPAVAAAGILVILGALGATEVGKVYLLGLLLPLYTKLRKEDILDQFTRGKIYGYILANPGDHYNSIQKALNIPNGTFAYHLNVLEKEGFIKSSRDGINRCFFPAGMKIPSSERALKASQKLILEKILERPGISQKDIASSLGVSSATVSYHIKGLLRLGVVETERRGMSLKYYISREMKPTSF